MPHGAIREVYCLTDAKYTEVGGFVVKSNACGLISACRPGINHCFGFFLQRSALFRWHGIKTKVIFTYKDRYREEVEINRGGFDTLRPPRLLTLDNSSIWLDN